MKQLFSVHQFFGKTWYDSYKWNILLRSRLHFKVETMDRFEFDDFYGTFWTMKKGVKLNIGTGIKRIMGRH